MARTITMREAINEALDQEMARDPSVVLMGEDIVGGIREPFTEGRAALREDQAVDCGLYPGERIAVVPFARNDDLGSRRANFRDHPGRRRAGFTNIYVGTGLRSLEGFAQQNAEDAYLHALELAHDKLLRAGEQTPSHEFVLENRPAL